MINPVILDTDIGGDIDDTWALAMLLKLKKFDVKLISITGYDTFYQVGLVAKFLTLAGRTDIPIAYNIPQDSNGGPQERWIGDFSIENYSGTIYSGTLNPMKEIIAKSDDKVKILSIGGKTNIAELLRNCDEALEKTVIYSMQGTIDRAYIETNVRLDIQAARQMLAYDVEKHIVPTEVCGKTILDGDLYQRLLESKDVLVQAVIKNYQLWWEDCDWNEHKQDIKVESSIMYDLVTLMYMMDDSDFITEDVNMYIDFDGYTHLDNKNGKRVTCAMALQNEKVLKEKMCQLLLEGAM